MRQLFTEASLSDSFIYNELNRSSNASATIIKAIKGGTILDKSYIEEQYIQIKRTRISPLLEDVLQAFDNGEINLVYNKQERVSIAIPFIMLNIGGKPKAYIFISDFSSLSKDESALTIDMKKLYTLLETAYIGKLFYTNPMRFKRSSAVLKILSTIYSAMAMRIFNKEFALSLDKDLYDKVNFIMAKFFLEKSMEIDNKQLSYSYAVASCLNISDTTARMISDEYDHSNISSINDVIGFIQTLSPKLVKLNFRYYFERWISTYGTSACLSIDTFPYLYFVIINVLLGGFLVNVAVLSDMVKNTKKMNLFYPEIKKLIL